MAKPISELINKLPPEVNAQATVKAAQMLTEMSLSELRKEQGVTQVELADSLGIKQPNVAQMEQREDVYLSTLRSYLEALGGSLEVVARFPDGKTINIRPYSSAQ